MQGWRRLDETIFISNDGSDEIIPVVGSVEDFFNSVVMKRNDMCFALRTLENFLKPGATLSLRLGDAKDAPRWHKVPVPA